VYALGASAIAYRGKARNHEWFYRFRSIEHRDETIEKFFDGVEARKRLMDERKEKRKSFRHDLKVGDILVNSWGYDQTNVDFYQVIRTTEKSVTLRMVRSQLTEDIPGPMAGYVTPVFGKFCGEEFTKPVREGNSVPMKFGYCGKCDRRPKYSSWYA